MVGGGGLQKLSIHRVAPNEVELEVHILILSRVCFQPKDSICG